MLEDLYREVILRHYQSPNHRRRLESPSVVGTAQNPLCGDEITIAAHIVDDRIADAAFEARGCSISQASADMMVDAIQGKPLDEVSDAIERFSEMIEAEAAPEREAFGELAVLHSVRRYPSRVKCALLPWVTLAQALERHAPKE